MSPRRDPNDARGILSIWNDIAPEKEDFYERWYMGEHFPERRGFRYFYAGGATKPSKRTANISLSTNSRTPTFFSRPPISPGSTRRQLGRKR